MSASQHHPPIRLGVLISGGGTTLRNLLVEIQAGRLNARVVVVIASSSKAGGLRFAAEAQVPSEVLTRTRELTSDSYGHVIFERCRQAQVDLVVMAGFLKHVTIPADFEGRVINIHPSLIPAFCGQGFYGHFVHEAVLEYGAKVSGCTVHLVDNQYDHGPIIAQSPVPVLPDDTPESLAARVFAEECRVYPQVIQAFSERRVQVQGRRVIVR